jgi:hypothetical protein
MHSGIRTRLQAHRSSLLGVDLGAANDGYEGRLDGWQLHATAAFGWIR